MTVRERTMTDPVRYPQSASLAVRTKRAFVLLLLTLFIPGAAQIVAGNRRFGRQVLKVTFTVWIAVIAAVVLALTSRPTLVGIVTHRWASLLLIIVLLALAVGWIFVFLNTLRLIQFPLLEKRVRPLIAGLLAVLMVVTSGSLAYGAYLLNVSRTTFGSIFQSGPAFDPVDGRYNFLLMGGDAGENRIGRRPDSISVVSVDATSGAVVTFSIPRNLQNARFSPDSPLWEEFPEGYSCGDQCIVNSLYPVVNQSYEYLYPESEDPGAEAMMDAASGILGLEVQAYILIDMGGFESVIDAMGGIRIDAGGWVPISSSDIPGTDPPRKYPPKDWIEPGVQTLDGYHALWYARSREFVTDYDRIARQQCVQQAMIAQLDPATVLTRFEAIANAGSEVVETDISIDQLGSFVDLALKAKNHETQTLTIGPPDFGTAADNFVTYPDFDLIHSRVQETLVSAGPEAAGYLPSGSTTGTTATLGSRNGDTGTVSTGIGSTGAASTGAVGTGTVSTGVGLSRGLPGVLPVQLPAQTTQPELTEEYLQQLAIDGDVSTLATLLADNGECSPA